MTWLPADGVNWGLPSIRPPQGVPGQHPLEVMSLARNWQDAIRVIPGLKVDLPAGE